MIFLSAGGAYPEHRKGNQNHVAPLSDESRLMLKPRPLLVWVSHFRSDNLKRLEQEKNNSRHLHTLGSITGNKRSIPNTDLFLLSKSNYGGIHKGAIAKCDCY